jgi:hypothetical protein
MKFVKNLLLLILLCSSYVISSSNLVTRHKRIHSHYKNKFGAKYKTTQGFLSTIIKYIVSPENIFYFVLGVISEWIEVAKTVFKFSREILPLVIGCFKTAEVVKDSRS